MWKSEFVSNSDQFLPFLSNLQCNKSIWIGYDQYTNILYTSNAWHMSKLQIGEAQPDKDW